MRRCNRETAQDCSRNNARPHPPDALPLCPSRWCQSRLSVRLSGGKPTTIERPQRPSDRTHNGEFERDGERSVAARGRRLRARGRALVASEVLRGVVWIGPKSSSLWRAITADRPQALKNCFRDVKNFRQICFKSGQK